MDLPKLTLEELSRFLDNELSESQREEVLEKLSECSTSEQLLSRLRELTTQISLNILTSSPGQDYEETAECLSEDDIIEIAEHKASTAKINQAEKHIASCKRCLLLVLQNIRTVVSMNANNWQDLPEQLATDSRISAVSKIKRPTHCIERAEEHMGEIRFNLAGNKSTLEQNFNKGKFSIDLILKKISTDIASIAITFSYDNKPKSQAEFTLTITPDAKQVFRGLTGQDGKTLIRRIQPEDYILRFKDIKAVILIKITNI